MKKRIIFGILSTLAIGGAVTGLCFNKNSYVSFAANESGAINFNGSSNVWEYGNNVSMSAQTSRGGTVQVYTSTSCLDSSSASFGSGKVFTGTSTIDNGVVSIKAECYGVDWIEWEFEMFYQAKVQLKLTYTDNTTFDSGSSDQGQSVMWPLDETIGEKIVKEMTFNIYPKKGNEFTLKFFRIYYSVDSCLAATAE